MGGPMHPLDGIELMDDRVLPHAAEEIPEVDPQWAQEALRNAEASFGETGEWGKIRTDEAARRDDPQ